MRRRKRGSYTGSKKRKRWRNKKENLEDVVIPKRTEALVNQNPHEEEEKIHFWIDTGKEDKKAKRERARLKKLSYERGLPPRKKRKQELMTLEEETKIKRKFDLKMKKRQKAQTNNPEKSKKKPFRDLWASPDPQTTPKPHNEWIPRPPKLNIPHSVTTKPTRIPSVEIAHPGQSYRPTKEDHQDILGEAVAEVLHKQEKEKSINKQLRRERYKKKPKIKEEEIDSDDELPVYVNAKDSTGDDVQVQKVEENSDDEKKADLDKKKPKDTSWSTKYSVTKRNKMERNRRNEIKKLRKTKRKHRNVEWANFNKIAKSVETELEEQEEELEKKKKKLKAVEGLIPAKIGKYRFEDVPKMEQVLTTDELPSSLRETSNSVDLWADRFKSWQKRNLIPTAPSQRPSSVVYRRRTHKKYERYADRKWTFDYETVNNNIKKNKK
eukprot:TRINITY_DN1350_c0_g1_i1.p1 TRINITY_DN1350_c0_g1~~TRINITY_DN1350_c0_g1_i1.p1  ORF type:complete len:447 (-),score=128.64 TRINITY_DN1350_c0_g1_i1:35-1345(-)